MTRARPDPRPSAVEIAAWIMMAIALVLVLKLHLLTALLAGLLVFELVHMIAPVIERRIFSRGHRMIAVALLAAIVIGLISAAVVGLLAFVRSDAGSFPALLHKMAEIIEKARTMLPGWMVNSLPDDVEELSTSV